MRAAWEPEWAPAASGCTACTDAVWNLLAQPNPWSSLLYVCLKLEVVGSVVPAVANSFANSGWLEASAACINKRPWLLREALLIIFLLVCQPAAWWQAQVSAPMVLADPGAHGGRQAGKIGPGGVLAVSTLTAAARAAALGVRVHCTAQS